jgi:hypothetical protein
MVTKHHFNVYYSAAPGSVAAGVAAVDVDVVTRGEWAKPSSDLFASLHCR